MSYLLVICFVILVICIILQTIMMHKEHKISINTKDIDNNLYKRHLTRIYCEGKEIFVTTDTIIGIGLIQLPENKYNVVINCENINDFVETYDSEEKAWERINELFDIIENE